MFTSCHLLAAALTLVAPDFGSPSIDPGKMQGSFVLGYRVDLPVNVKSVKTRGSGTRKRLFVLV